MSCTLDDDRKLDISLRNKEAQILLVEKFEPESRNAEGMQRKCRQAILDNFKGYVEGF